jgi:hypothetical protein
MIKTEGNKRKIFCVEYSFIAILTVLKITKHCFMMCRLVAGEPLDFYQRDAYQLYDAMLGAPELLRNIVKGMYQMGKGKGKR